MTRNVPAYEALIIICISNQMSFCFSHILVSKLQTSPQDGEREQNVESELELLSPQTDSQEGGEEEEEEGEEKTYEEGQELEEQELCEETPEEEEVKVEWPTGVPQASDKDLAKLSSTAGVCIHILLLVWCVFVCLCI